MATSPLLVYDAMVSAAKNQCCKQCASPLENGYCTDDTCCFSDWPQSVEREDLENLSMAAVETKYHVQKRVRAEE